MKMDIIKKIVRKIYDCLAFTRAAMPSEETIVFGKYIFLLKMCGLNPNGGRANIIARIINSFIWFSFSLLTSVFLALNIRQDIDRILPVLCILVPGSGLILVYCYFLIVLKWFYSLLEELHDIIGKSEYLKASTL